MGGRSFRARGPGSMTELLARLVDQLSFERVDTGGRMHMLVLDHGQDRDLGH
jgi:hypothetical protein